MVQRLPDFLLHAVRGPSASADAPSAADQQAADVGLYEALEDEWPDPLDVGPGLVVRYLGEDARDAYFDDTAGDADPTG